MRGAEGKMESGYQIRHAKESDLDTVLSISNSEQRWVGEEEPEFFKQYLSLPHLYVAERLAGSNIAGFIMAMDQTVEYESLNFHWFRERYPEFLYIDRVVVRPESRRQGIATALYGRLIKEKKGPLVCEVAIHPVNDESIVFHEKMGFVGVGEFASRPPKMCRMYKLD